MLAVIYGLGATFEPYSQLVQSSDMNFTYESTGFWFRKSAQARLGLTLEDKISVFPDIFLRTGFEDVATLVIKDG